MIPAGRKNHQVWILQPRDLQGESYSDQRRVYDPWRQLWAEIRPTTGAEVIKYGVQGAEINYSITVGWFDWLSHKQRLQHPDGRVFDIISPPIDIDGERTDALLLCREHVKGDDGSGYEGVIDG